MNTELNKQVSVWRGNNTPPTDYHLWIKENGDILIKIQDNWSTVANVTNLGDISTLKEDLSTTKTDLGELKQNVEGLKIQEVEAETPNTLKSYSLIYNGESKGIINIPKDRFLKNVQYDQTTKKLIFTFIISDGTETTQEISVADLVDVYKAGNNVTIKDNTISVDFSPITEVLDTTIKCIWRLEGGEKKEIELNGDEIDLGGLTLDQWLIKRGNYAAVEITPRLSMPPTTGPVLFLDLGDTKIYYTAYVLNGQLKGTIDVMVGKEIVYTDEVPNDDSNATVYVYPKCIKTNDYKTAGYMLKSKIFEHRIQIAPNKYVMKDEIEVGNINRVCYNFGLNNGTFLIPFSSKNNYGIEFADGHYERLNKTDNVVIGGNTYCDGFYAERFHKEGSLEVNGSLKAKDAEVQSLNMLGLLTCRGIDASGTINNGTYPLKVGETTINGTLHVEDHDIKTQSLYPAKTGSSTLKDASKGEVKGNYKVSAGNLGKGAHNYDKLFVKNIMWSDQTDITSEDTSLNGEGTIQVWSKEGIGKNPTLWLGKGRQDDESYLGIYGEREYNYSGSKIVLAEMYDGTTEAPSHQSFIFDFDNGTLNSDYPLTPKGSIWGLGMNYNENNKIPSSFVEGMDTKADSSSLANYLPLTGGTISNSLNVTGTLTAGGKTVLTSHQPIYKLTLQKNGSNVGIFTPTDSDSTLNISVPTKLSELTDDVVNGKYLPSSGGTLNGMLRITSSSVIESNSFGTLTIKRSEADTAAVIQFSGKTGLYGGIGFDTNHKDQQLCRWNSDHTAIYEVLDTSTTSIQDQTIKINNVSRTIPTKLSELTNDIVEACTTDEINALFE